MTQNRIEARGVVSSEQLIDGLKEHTFECIQTQRQPDRSERLVIRMGSSSFMITSGLPPALRNKSSSRFDYTQLISISTPDAIL